MIKPLGHQVLIQELPPKPTSDGGIMLPQSLQKTEVYHVIAVGPKVTDIEPGNNVLLDHYTLSSKPQAGPGQFIVNQKHVAIVIP